MCLETVASKTLRKAKKHHKCSWCRQDIPKGMMYETSTLKNEGELYVWKNHTTCALIVDKLDIENFDDGVTSEDFCETINYQYEKITNYNNTSKGYPIPFKERLELVLKHYNIN